METPQEFDIKKYLELVYQKRYVFVAIMVIVTSLAIAVSYIMPNIYEAKSTVLIEKNLVNDMIRGLAVAPSIDDRTRSVEIILKSRPLILEVIKDLDLDLTRKSDIEVEKLVQALRDATDVKIEMNRAQRSDMEMFTVSFRNGNATIARDYVNVLVRRYVEENLTHKRDETYGASKFIQEQINVYKDKISSIEADIAHLRRSQGIVGQGSSQESFQESGQVRMLALQKRLDELRLQYTESHPDIMKVKAEIELLRNQSKGIKRTTNAGRVAEQQQPNLEDPARGSDVAQSIGSSETGNITNESAQKTRNQGMESSESTMSKPLKIAALERDLVTYQRIYDDLMTSLGRSEVSSHIEVEDKGGTFKILEPAILPRHPVSPNRVMIILIGLFAGIGGGAGLIILLDTIDNSVKSVDNVKTFGLPVLGVIPHIENPGDMQKMKRHDLLLYTIAGVYLVGVGGLLTFEFLKRGMQ